MHSQAEAFFHTESAAFYVLRVDNRPEFAGAISGKQRSNPYLLFSRQQINTDGISAHIDSFYIDHNPALSASGVQFGKSDIFTFYPAFVCVDI